MPTSVGERSGGKTGRGSENKVPFVVAVQTSNSGEPHRVCMAQLPFRRSALADFAAARLLRPLVSDGLDCFNVAAGAGVHERVVTGGGRASAKLPQFAAVNTILGNFKTGIAGTYHAFKFGKYLGRYQAEFQYRFNRRFDLKSMLPRLLSVAVRIPALPQPPLKLAWMGQAARNWHPELLSFAYNDHVSRH